MSILDSLSDNPNLRRILVNSKLLDILPGGFSIATDVSCETIIHNPVVAQFLRIEPYGQFSHSAKVPPKVAVYQGVQFVPAHEMPLEQATRYGKETVGRELEFIWEDGTSKIARWNASPLRDEDGTIYGAIATMEDITNVVHMARELHQHKVNLEGLVEERTSELRKSEEQFSKIFQNSPQAQAIFRKSDTSLVEANNQFLSMLHCLREELIGKTPVELGLPKNDYLMLQGMTQQHESIKNIEYSFWVRNDHKVTIFLSTEHIQFTGEECTLITFSNISELKRMQAEMARLDRLNIVGKMAAGFAHEIRNPMTSVRGYLQLLGIKSEFKSYWSTFDLMISELDRANSIITEYLSLARNLPTDTISKNINDILNNLYPLLEAETNNQDKQIVFEAGNTPDILMDTKEITQLILNLFRNGLEAMKERGTITLRTFTKDDQVVLCVQDEGMGIPEEHIEKLGMPFFTTKEKGTGLGLATSYSIVERHKGKIEVKSGLGGTKFFVYLPIN